MSAAANNQEWGALNERQRRCLQIILALDQERERYYTRDWPNDANQVASDVPPPPPASAWRWLQYDPSHNRSDPTLRQRLRLAGIGGRGIKATFNALWARDLIRIKYERLGRYRVLSLQLTARGRQAAQWAEREL